MKEEKSFTITQYRANFGSLITGLLCLYNVFTSWGDNWYLVVIFSAGVIICGTFAFYDIKRVLQERQPRG
ncbi:hypothetical protein P4U90_20270 [Cytobacillus kochii]|uniref:hypothetical protein n=1 Tax=Cytobacillus kochii TaxID=859143 RepID=UPI002E1F91E2|nr:hypothetical protein [Cytobacillus kochii]